MNRLFIKGDTHGNFDFLEYFCEAYHTKITDTLVILGDAGFNFYKGSKAHTLKRWVSKFPITITCVRGNHEDRPQNRGIPLIENQTVNQVTGAFYHEEAYPNIYYFVDGDEYTYKDKNFLVIGGAYSVDKWYRLQNHYTWFEDEQLNDAERRVILDNIEKHHYHWVFTHTCPTEWMPTDLFLKGIDQSMVDNTTERWLSEVERAIAYDHWYFGHFHGERDFTEYMTMLYIDVREITNE